MVSNKFLLKGNPVVTTKYFFLKEPQIKAFFNQTAFYGVVMSNTVDTIGGIIARFKSRQLIRS